MAKLFKSIVLALSLTSGFWANGSDSKIGDELIGEWSTQSKEHGLGTFLILADGRAFHPTLGEARLDHVGGEQYRLTIIHGSSHGPAGGTCTVTIQKLVDGTLQTAIADSPNDSLYWPCDLGALKRKVSQHGNISKPTLTKSNARLANEFLIECRETIPKFKKNNVACFEQNRYFRHIVSELESICQSNSVSTNSKSKLSALMDEGFFTQARLAVGQMYDGWRPSCQSNIETATSITERLSGSFESVKIEAETTSALK